MQLNVATEHLTHVLVTPATDATVFVIDDDILVRDSLKEPVRAEGLRPETFASRGGIARVSTATESLPRGARFMLPALSVSNCKRNSSRPLPCPSSSSPAARTFLQRCRQ